MQEYRQSPLPEETNPSVPYWAFKRALAQIGITRTIRVHDLRHTAASLMIQQGTPVKAVQDILGHSDYATTMKYYVTANEKMMRQGTDALEALLSG